MKIDTESRRKIDADVRYRMKVVAKLERNAYLVDRLIKLQLKDMRTVNLRVNYIQARYELSHRRREMKRLKLDEKIRVMYDRLVKIFQFSKD